MPQSCGNPSRRLRTAARVASATPWTSAHGIGEGPPALHEARNASSSARCPLSRPAPEAVMNGWMNSEGHRQNILNCAAKATGVGLAYRGSTAYWTQLFGRI